MRDNVYAEAMVKLESVKSILYSLETQRNTNRSINWPFAYTKVLYKNGSMFMLNVCAKIRVYA